MSYRHPILLVLFSILFSSPYLFAARQKPLRAYSSGNPVSLAAAIHIAESVASDAWGDDLRDLEVVPYYSYRDDLIAWRLTWSLGKPFPEREHLLEELSQKAALGDFPGQWGAEEFATVLMSARDDIPPILERMQSLSPEYGLHSDREILAAQHLGSGGTWGKAWFINFNEIWYEYTLNGQTMLVNPFPKPEVKTESEFTDYRGRQTGFFVETGDYASTWRRYQVDPPRTGRSDVLIPDESRMPFLQWTYGCSPCSGSMLYAWYDYRSIDHTVVFSRFIDYHLMRWDDIQNHWEYHVPNITAELALAMGTDSEGGTEIPNIPVGMEAVASNNGYSVSSDYSWIHDSEWYWSHLQSEINQGIPLISGIVGHSMVGVGYNLETEEYINHDPNYPSLNYRTRSSLNHFVLVHPTEGSDHTPVNLIAPHGDLSWSGDGNGEEFSADDVISVIWESRDEATTFANIYYSTQGGTITTWNLITPSPVANNGLYHWRIPAGINSNECRVRVDVIDSTTGELLGADGSNGNFIIEPGAGLPALWVDYPTLQETNPEYYSTTNIYQRYAVVGSRSIDPTDHYGVELFSDANFGTQIAESTGAFTTNYVVMNDHDFPNSVHGVRVAADNPQNRAWVHFEGGSEILTVCEESPQHWTAGEVVRVWDVWLKPGRHQFDLFGDGGDQDLDMALYYFPTAPYAGSRFDYFQGASSYNDGNGGDEQFVCTVYDEGWYGLVVSARNYASADYTLRISDPGTWSGEVSEEWQDPLNWVGRAVPDEDTDVTIFGNTPESPRVYTAPMVCGNLDISAGSFLRIGNDTSIHGNVNVGGMLILGTIDNQVYVMGHLHVDGRISDIDPMILHVAGAVTTSPGSEFDLDESTLEFYGAETMSVNSQGSVFIVNNMTVNKSGSAYLILSDNSTCDISVMDYLNLEDNNLLVGDSPQELTLVDGLNFGTDARCQFNAGRVRMYFGHDAFMNPGDDSWFNDFELDYTALTVDGHLHIKGNLAQNFYSTINFSGSELLLEGDWINDNDEGGQPGSDDLLILGGNHTQHLDGNFILGEIRLNKTDSSLICDSLSQITCDLFDNWQGTLEIHDAEFEALDISMFSLTGDYVVNGGMLTLHQDLYQTTGLDAAIEISGGEMKVTGGGMNNSNWPFSQNASVTMTGGRLSFSGCGIYFQDNAHDLDLNISDGEIRTTGDIDGNRPVQLTAGALVLMGDADTGIGQPAGSTYHDVIIKKMAITRDSELNSIPTNQTDSRDRDDTTTLLSDLDISGELRVENGFLELSGTDHLSIGGDLIIEHGLRLRDDARIDVGNDLFWAPTTCGDVTGGEFHLENGTWTFSEDVNADFGGTSLVSFDNTHASGTIVNHSVDASFMNLHTDQVYQTTCISSESTEPVVVNGTLSIADGNTFSVGNNDLIVAEQVTIGEYSDFTIGTTGSFTGSVLVVEGDLDCNGGASITLSSHLAISSIGEMRMGTGSCTCSQINNRNYLRLWGGSIQTGDLTLQAGSLDVRAGSTVDMDGNLILTSGASLLCEEDADDITLHLAGNWYNMNTANDSTQGFTPGLSEVRFDGTGSQSLHTDADEAPFYHLVLAGTDGTFQTYAPLNIQGTFAHYEGTVVTGTEDLVHTFESDFIIGTHGVWQDSTARLLFTGEQEQLLSSYSTLPVALVTINKPAVREDSHDTRHPVVRLGHDASFRQTQITLEAGDLDLESYTLEVAGSGASMRTYPESTLIMGPDAALHLENGMELLVAGDLEMTGEADHEAEFSPIRNGYITLILDGQIRARYATFDHLGTSGVTVTSNAVIDPDYAFYQSTFSNGAPGGTLLTLDNNQRNLVLDQLNFENQLGSQYNVSKTEDYMFQYPVLLANAYGDFAGPGFENDPLDAINWDMTLDLSLTQIRAMPEVALIGDTITVAVTVSNPGLSDVGNVPIGVYHDMHHEPQYGETPDQILTIPLIEAGETITVTTTVTSALAGVWHTWALVDWDQQIPETNEINNTLDPAVLTWIDLPAISDLQIQYVSSMERITLTWNYENPVTEYRIYGSSDPYFVPTQTELLGTSTHPSWDMSFSGDNMFFIVTAVFETVTAESQKASGETRNDRDLND